MFKEDLKNIKERVNMILVTYIETRDSDKLLWLKYMEIYNGLKFDIEIGDYDNFVKTIMSSSTPNFESLSRARRKIQEMDEMLRGNLYHDRKYQAIEVAKYMKEL